MRNPFTAGKMVPLGALLALATVVVLTLPGGRRAVGREAPDAGAGRVFNGATECKRCHTQPTADDRVSLPFVMLTEYAVWKTLDKHAQAFAVLKTERSQQMGKILKIKVDKADACLNCHAMNALKKTASEAFDPEDGVNCAGCHGPSQGEEGWFKAHSEPKWRKLTPAEKSKKGLVDLRDPDTRARLCMSCHVGNAAEGKVVTHEMFAAGHPPLPPFEVATFSQNMPPHWREPKHVPFFHMLQALAVSSVTGKDAWEDEVRRVVKEYLGTNPGRAEVRSVANLYPNAAEARKVIGQYPFAEAATYQTRLALVGNVTALGETMRLVVDRAGMGTGKDPKWLWPELAGGTAKPEAIEEHWPTIAMAHSDCYACHHDLRSPSYRQKRGYGYRLPGGGMVTLKPGRVPLRSWSLSALTADLRVTTPDEARFRDAVAPLARDLGAVARACDVRPFGDPARIGKAAKDLAVWCGTVNKELRTAALNRDKVRDLLRSLCRADALAYADYESARQTASVFATAYAEVGPPAAADAGAIQLVLDGLNRDLNLKPYRDREERQRLILKLIQDAVVKEYEKEDGKKDEARVRRLEAGVQQFRESVQNRDDMKRLMKLADNRFLTAVRGTVQNEDWNRIIQKGVAELGEKNEKELRSALDKIATYSPARFQERMRALGEALSGKAPKGPSAATR